MKKEILFGLFGLVLGGTIQTQASSGAALTLEDAINAALASSPLVKESEATAKRSDIQSSMSLSPFLPKLALEAGTIERAPKDQNTSGRFLYGDATWNLYNGGLDQLAARAEEIEAQRARTKLILAKAQVSREVTKEFAELLYIDEAMRMKKEELALNKEQMQIARRKAQGGLTSNADVLEFEFRENALNTELALLTHERALTSRALATLMGSEPRSDLKVTGKLSPDLTAPAAAPDATPEFMRSERMLDPQTEASLADLEYSGTLATWLPKADINARYGNLEYADPDVEGVPGWRLEFKLTLPLFSGVETFSARQLAAARQYEASAKLRRADLDTKNALIDRDEKLAVLETLLSLQKENMARAERYYQATLTEYKRGLKNSPDLSGATERMFESRLKNNALIKDLLLTKLGLLESTKSELP